MRACDGALRGAPPGHAVPCSGDRTHRDRARWMGTVLDKGKDEWEREDGGGGERRGNGGEGGE